MKLKQQDKYTALYCRLSQEDRFGNGGDSSSIQTQKAMLSQFAKDNDLGNTIFYIDDGASGTTFERENFQRMISDMEDGKISCIVTKDLSRLGRNYLEAGRYRELFSEYGVRYIAISDGYDSFSDDGGDIATPIKEIIHEFYARDCSRKVKSAYRTKAKNGGVVSGIPPYGYMRVEGEKNKLQPDPETAPNVQRMFRMALEGKTYTQIAIMLKNEKVLTPKAYLGSIGRRRSNGEVYDFNVKHPYVWGHSTVQMILLNPIYTGKIVCMKLANKSFKDKKKIVRPREDWIVTENAHEPLVSQQDFDSVGERARSKQRPFALNELNIFRGLIFCNDCNRRLAFRASKYPHFRCQSNQRYGKDFCSGHNITLENLTALVLSDIKRHSTFAAKNSKKYVEHLLSLSEREEGGKRTTLKKESEKCRRRLDEIDTLIMKLYEDKVFEVISVERFTAMSAKLEVEQSELKARYAELSEYLSNSVEKSRNADSFAELIRQYTDITALDEELVHTLIEKIVVHETEVIDGEKVKRVDIYYRFIGNVDEADTIVSVSRGKLAEVS